MRNLIGFFCLLFILCCARDFNERNASEIKSIAVIAEKNIVIEKSLYSTGSFFTLLLKEKTVEKSKIVSETVLLESQLKDITYLQFKSKKVGDSIFVSYREVGFQPQNKEWVIGGIVLRLQRVSDLEWLSSGILEGDSSLRIK